MKNKHVFLLVIAVLCAMVRAQTVPSAASSDSHLVYDIRYSQAAQTYSDKQPFENRSVASAELSYLNASAGNPLSITYSGGAMWAIDGSPSGTGAFQHLLASKGIIHRQWNLTLTDDISYLPQSPTTGFSGLPGVGALPPSPGPSTQPILLQNTRNVDNNAEASFIGAIDYDKTIGLRGGYRTLRYPDGNGLETNEMLVTPHFAWNLDRLNVVSVDYKFSRFTYPGSTFTMGTQSILGGYSKIWSRRASTTMSVGPEWVTSSDTSLVPAKIGIAADASLSYQARSISTLFSYYRATGSGAGAGTLIGIDEDQVSFVLTRNVGRSLSLAANGSYNRTHGFLQSGVTEGTYSGVQASRRLGKFMSVFGNYTLIRQSSSITLPSNAIDGLSQVFGFGVSYSPKELHLSKQ